LSAAAGVLVHSASRVLEIGCEGCGEAACRFEIRWRPSPPAAGKAGQKR